MPRTMVFLAALLITGAALFGAYHGYEMTDLDTPSAAIMPVSASRAAGPAEPALQPAMDETSVRELARLEVRDLMRDAPRAAPTPVRRVEIAAAQPAVIETPATEPIAPAASLPIVAQP